MDSTNSQSATESLQAQVHVYNHMLNHINSMCLKCAVQLRIPDVIHNHGEPVTLPELLSALHIHPSKTDALYRLMRMLVHLGFFSTTEAANGQQGEEAYDLTPSSRLLVKDNPNCLTPFVNFVIKPEIVTPGHFLKDWFLGDELTVFQKAHGLTFWEHHERTPEFRLPFNEAMASDSRMMNLILRDCKPIVEGIDSVIDVGGGDGSLAKAISEAFPNIKCAVLELPQVIANLEGTANLNYVGGDMFQHIPSADAIILKLILHSWNDEECLKILKKCKEAILREGKESGKLIVIDVVINEKKDEHELAQTKLQFDMLMMLVATGKERTEKQWADLFLRAGFSHFKITPILGLKSLIEVYP